MRLFVGCLLASIVLAVAYAFAASLDSDSGGLGAGSKVIASCGNGIKLGYTTTFDASISSYAVDRLDVSNIPAGCLRKTLSVTFYDSSRRADGSAISDTLPVSDTSQSISIDPDSNAIAAGQISGVSAVVW